MVVGLGRMLSILPRRTRSHIQISATVPRNRYTGRASRNAKIDRPTANDGPVLEFRPPPEVAYLDNCFNAKAHSRSGSRSPSFASSIISLATAVAAGSLRSTNPSLPKAVSKAADKRVISSGPNE